MPSLPQVCWECCGTRGEAQGGEVQSKFRRIHQAARRKSSFHSIVIILHCCLHTYERDRFIHFWVPCSFKPSAHHSVTSTSVCWRNEEWMNKWNPPLWQSRLRHLGRDGAAGLPAGLQAQPAEDVHFPPHRHLWILPETLGKDCTVVFCKMTRKMKDSEDGNGKMHELDVDIKACLGELRTYLCCFDVIW